MTDIKYDTMQDELAGQRVMLVGGAGFIGHNLALELRRLGVETMVVDNLMVNSLIENVFESDDNPLRSYAYQSFLLDRFRLMRAAGVHLRNADARLYADLSRAFDEFKPTKVVQLAAIASAVRRARIRGSPSTCN